MVLALVSVFFVAIPISAVYWFDSRTIERAEHFGAIGDLETANRVMDRLWWPSLHGTRVELKKD